uniref:Uncharacterized protein n=1 Tax=Arundo donax TaxID=35708 RepID=A0A0A9E2F8_ARUDO
MEQSKFILIQKMTKLGNGELLSSSSNF